MKLLEIVNMMDIKEHQQVWSTFFQIKKIRFKVSVKETLAEQLHKPVTKKLIQQKPMRDLNTIFGQQIQLKWYIVF